MSIDESDESQSKSRDGKLSFEEIVYDTINEIPLYFNEDKLCNDDYKIIEIRRKSIIKTDKVKHSKSLDKIKNSKDKKYDTRNKDDDVINYKVSI